MSGLINPAAAAAGTGLSPGNRFSNFVSGVTDTGISALSSVVPGLGPLAQSLIGSGVSFLGNLLSSRYSANLSKELYDYQTDYKKLMDSMTKAGINPGAAAQGLSGATPSMQSVSSHAAPDLSSLGSLSLEAQRNPSIIAKNESDTMLNKMRSSEIGQLMQFNPLRWNAEIRKALSEVEVNTSNSWYLNELARTVKMKRPWEIWNLQRGYELLGAQITNQLSQAGLFGSQKEYFGQRTKNEKVLTFINRCQASFWRMGLNPFENPFRSLIRLSASNPKAAEGIVGNSLKFLGFMDDRISDVAGKNWKKFAAAGVALHYINNRLGEHNTKKSQRFRNKVQSAAGLAGIAGSLMTGSPAPAAASSLFMNSDNTLLPLPSYFGGVYPFVGNGNSSNYWDMW